jgi:valyl-tRNA synthetase
VERSLALESLSRHDLGRDGFIERIWKWKEKHGGAIINQLKRLGASADWTRERFTMDEGFSHAVRKVFCELYRQGLIYKDVRLVNWDPELHTAISDLEVETREVKGKLWYIRYPLEGSPGEYITVATTRPETMLGDTAVAVHPDDERYRYLVGRYAVLPLVGRRIPIIADSYSDPSKGSGAVKITPAHDFNDFEVGRRHGLPLINILDRNGALNENVPERFRGLDRFEARHVVVKELESLGLIEKVEDHTHAVPYGDRSGAVIEPWLTEQWYVDAKVLAAPAIRAVEEGRIRFIPERWTNTYYEWMRNIQPWCISRQIWWGHRIPAWYGPDGHVFAELTEADALRAAEAYYGSRVDLRQDEDVLDTWFSSALWPFATLGWPNDTKELKTYYPTSVLVTGFDIIFFWVARMIMMGLRFMGDVPFREVCIHGLVRDEYGEKMSKTKGNVIDPLDIMDKYGADSLRFSLAALTSQGRDVRLSISVIEGYRNFINKIWNASRFLFLNLDGFDPGFDPKPHLTVIDRWILTRLNQTIRDVNCHINGYEFDKACRSIYQFVWGDYCDWYIEFVKPLLSSDDSVVRATAKSLLVKILLVALRLLHPIAPFITEEVFQRLRRYGVTLRSTYGEEVESIMTSSFPEYDESECDEEALKEIEFVKDIITSIRNLRASLGLHPSAKARVMLYAQDIGTLNRVSPYAGVISSLARLDELSMSAESRPARAIAQVLDGIEVFMPVEGLIDVPREMERINREIAKLSRDIELSLRKLSNRDFIERAPGEVVEKEKEKFSELSAKKAKLEELLDKFSQIS